MNHNSGVQNRDAALTGHSKPIEVSQNIRQHNMVVCIIEMTRSYVLHARKLVNNQGKVTIQGYLSHTTLYNQLIVRTIRFEKHHHAESC